MKKLSLFLPLLLCCFLTNAQDILVVDNTPTAPTGDHVYTDFQTAVDSANVGDIIHLIPSVVSYGSCIIEKELSVYGIGYTPDTETGYTSQVTVIYIRGEAADNVKISGLHFINTAGGVSIGGNTGDGLLYEMDSIVVESCYLQNLRQENNYGVITNMVVKNNIFSELNFSSYNPIQLITTLGRTSGVLITNNILHANPTASVRGTIRAGNFTVITNNLFSSDGVDDRYAFENLTDCIVSNNIFFGVNTGHKPGSDFFNNTFANNISFAAFDNTLPPIGEGGTNGGFGNIENSDPMLTSVGLYGFWDLNDNPELLAGSPALLAGSDGFDIGLSGGTYPFRFYGHGTTLPYIHLLENAGLVIEGQDLNVIIEARSNQ